MSVIKKISYIASTLIVLLALLLWNKYQHLTYLAVIIIFTFFILNLLLLFYKKIVFKDWPNFFIPGFLFLISSILFYSLIDKSEVRIIFSILVTAGYFIELHNLFIYIYTPERYQPYALENIHGYVNLISMFFFSTSLYGYTLFFTLPNWTIIIIVFLLSVLLSWRTLVSYKIEKEKILHYAFIPGLLIAQTALMVNFLPTSYLFNGLIITICYYFLINYLRDYLRDMYDRKNLLKYLVISATSLFISLLTTRWF